MKRRVLLNLTMLIVVTIVIVSSLSIASIYRRGKADVEAYREQQMASTRQRLMTYLEIAESTLLASTKSTDSLSKAAAIELVAEMRYDNGEGYFWITDNQLPYPTMLKHGIRKEETGLVLDDDRFNTLTDFPDKNLYQFLVEESAATGQAFAKYEMKKPGEVDYIPKLAYARRIPELDLILYTGVYLDQVEQNVRANEEAVMMQIQSVVAIVVIFTIAILMASLLLVNYYIGQLITLVLKVKEALIQLSKGQTPNKISNRRKDELKEMTNSLNVLIDKFDAYASLAQSISDSHLEDTSIIFETDDKMGRALMKMRQKLAEFIQSLQESNEELTETNQSLSRKMSELQAAQEQLIQSEKMTSLGLLTAGVAHEINNPLNFIKGAHEGLRRHFEEGKHDPQLIASLLECIREGFERTATIVEILSQFSGKGQFLFGPVAIKTVVDNCFSILHNQYEGRITIEKDYSPVPLFVNANSGQLHQLMVNVVQNAIQAIPKNGKIVAKVERYEGMVRISVSDEGVGMNRETLEKAMDPFFSTKAPGEGTGLGLSVVYNIVREHHGTVNISSEQGVGTEVVIELPEAEVSG